MILVEKDGEQLEIHESTLANHQALGWVIVEVVEKEAPKPKAKK